MALINYQDLQSAVGRWLDRDDLVSQIPDFITLAEMKINRQLRVLAMENRYVIPLQDEINEYALPPGFILMRNIYLAGSPDQPLEYQTPEIFTWNSYNTPWAYTISNNTISINGGITQGMQLAVEYFKRFDVLSNSNTTNWLTENAMDILMYGSLLEAEAFLMTDDRLQVWSAAYSNTLQMLNDEAEEARHSGSALRVRGT